MYTHIAFASFAIAGAAVLWRNWLNDHPAWKKKLMELPFRVGHAFLCGSCFTYWLALAYIFIFDPFRGISLHNPHNLDSGLFLVLSYFVFWMMLSWLGVTLRFGYVLIQECVAYAVHHWRKEEHHHH